MEAQTYMWTAFAMTGDPFYERSLKQLLDWGYHTYTVREKVTFPPEDVVPWDDELAFRCFHPLLTYGDDPYLRSIYLRTLARHWEVLRLQKIPFFNFVYGGLTGNDCESRQAVLGIYGSGRWTRSVTTSATRTVAIWPPRSPATLLTRAAPGRFRRGSRRACGGAVRPSSTTANEEVA